MQRIQNFKESLLQINQYGREIFVWINTLLYNYRGYIVPLILIAMAAAFVYLGYIVIPKKIAERAGMPRLQFVCIVLFTLLLCGIFYVMSR